MGAKVGAVSPLRPGAARSTKCLPGPDEADASARFLDAEAQAQADASFAGFREGVLDLKEKAEDQAYLPDGPRGVRTL